MKTFAFDPDGKGISLIELVIATAIVSIVATMIIPMYSAYRMRAQRFHGQSCLLNLAQQQEAYFARHGQYVTDLTRLGYGASRAAICAGSDQYHLTATLLDAAVCPSGHCYQLSAIPRGEQVEDGTLYLTYDASKTDASQRLKKERGEPGSGRTWN